MVDKKEDDKKPAAAAQRPGPVIRYLDRPDCLETFADSISGLTFDGQTLRLEFAVTRTDDVKPNAQATAPALPGLPPGAATACRSGLDQPYAAGRRGPD